jgi:hypothetical protein
LDGAEQRDARDRDRRRVSRGRRNAGAQPGKMRDQRIVPRQRVAMARQGGERGGDVEHLFAADEAEAVITETA